MISKPVRLASNNNNAQLWNLSPPASNSSLSNTTPTDLHVLNEPYHSYAYADGSCDGPTIVLMGQTLTRPLSVEFFDNEGWSAIVEPESIVYQV